jgi:hypothetical protein
VTALPAPCTATHGHSRQVVTGCLRHLPGARVGSQFHNPYDNDTAARQVDRGNAQGHLGRKHSEISSRQVDG